VLKDRLRAAGLKVSGRKAELIDRLQQLKGLQPNGRQQLNGQLDGQLDGQLNGQLNGGQLNRGQATLSVAAGVSAASQAAVQSAAAVAPRSAAVTRPASATASGTVTGSASGAATLRPATFATGEAIIAEPTPRRSVVAPATGTGAATLRLATWNVAGLRGLLKRPEGVETLRALVHSEQVDVLMLQV
jgi:hypothetical protein